MNENKIANTSITLISYLINNSMNGKVYKYTIINNNTMNENKINEFNENGYIY